MKNNRGPLFGSMVLLLTSVIWGLAFVAQSAGMRSVGPFTFQCVRSFLGLLTILPVLILRYRRNQQEVREGKARNMFEFHNVLMGGLGCGLAFTFACTIQQMAMKTAGAGKAGFLTALYLVFLPVFGFFLGQKIPKKIIFCVIFCMGGIYLLSVSETSGMNASDVMLIVCAAVFAMHIMIVNAMTDRVDGVCLSFCQLLFSVVSLAVPALVFDHPTWSALKEAAPSILYSGIMSSGIAYTLQIIGQRYTPPVTAGLILSLESVFALLGGMLILQQIPTLREASGCVLVFAAVIYSQIPERKKTKNTVGEDGISSQMEG